MRSYLISPLVLLAFDCAPAAVVKTPVSPAPAPASAPVATRSTWIVPAWNGGESYTTQQSARVTSRATGKTVDVPQMEGAIAVVRSEGVAGEASISAQDKSGTRVAAEVVGGIVHFTQPSSYSACDAHQAALRAELLDLSLSLPGALAPRLSWTDSTEMETCLSDMPGVAVITRRFEVTGDTLVAGERAVVVERSDSIVASGAGAVDRHTTTLSAGGSARARVYISVASGRILLVDKTAYLNISATSPGRSDSFVELARTRLEVVR